MESITPDYYVEDIEQTIEIYVSKKSTDQQMLDCKTRTAVINSYMTIIKARPQEFYEVIH